jgi:hypothetical protein
MDILIDVVGYEGRYKINKNGEVWDCKMNRFITFHLDKDGYKIVSLKNPNKKKKLHRLLGINFIPNPNNHPLIDHIDRNNTNNNLENLRWTTKKINCLNRKTPPNCRTGHKNISHSSNKVSWIIQLYNGDKRICICLAKSKYTLEQVIAIRNEKCIEFGLEICD